MAGLVPFNRNRSALGRAGFGGLHNMLDDFFGESWPARSLARDTFKIDVMENENEYVIEAEMPGVKKEEIELSLDDGRLAVGFTKDENVVDDSENYIHRERRSCSMCRMVYLHDADAENITAKLEDGILKVKVQKDSKKKTVTKIEVE